MEDKRTARRLRKRVTLRFGIEAPVRIAFTEDLSDTGMFIKTTNICPPGSRILVEFSPDEVAQVRLECRVIWAKKVPPQLIHMVKKSGMGVRILQVVDGEETFRRYCSALNEVR
jgi:hypothetical protein